MRDPRLQALARKMRNNPTRAEFLLWQKLRCGRRGVKFRRQKMVMGYIVDFYCHKAKLAIEVDGSYHDVNRDKWRDSVLKERGITVLRFANETVIRDGLRVVAHIEEVIDSLL